MKPEAEPQPSQSTSTSSSSSPADKPAEEPPSEPAEPATGGSDEHPTLKSLILGKAKDVEDPKVLHALSLIAFLAWVGLGADGLSSSAYGPAEAFKALGPHT